MKLLAVHITTCLLAVSLLVAVAVGDEAASNEAASSESVSSDESIPASGSEEIASSGDVDAVSSSGDVDSGSGEATESGSGAAEDASGDSIDEGAVPVIEFKDVDEDEREGAVTFVTKYSKVMEADDIAIISHTLAKLVEQELARMEEEQDKSTRHRRSADEYEVTIIAPTPRFSVDDAELLEIVFFARGPEGVVPQETLLAAMLNLEESGALAQHNMPTTSVHGGYPEDLDDFVIPAARTSGDRGVWRNHLGLFIAIIGLAVVCLIILIIGFACLKCRSKRGSWTRTDDSAPITMEDGKGYQYELNSPLPDEEIVKDEAPMVESANGGEPAWSNKNWLMPMDDSRPEETPSTDNTKF